MREFLQSYKIVMNIEQKASKNKHLVRGFENTQENFANFSAEVGQLLCRSFGARRVAGFHSCCPLAKMDASFGARGRVVFHRGQSAYSRRYLQNKKGQTPYWKPDLFILYPLSA